MKRFLLLALCALFACQAEARTLYVDAKRPNNKGNGLSKAKAKKTIQAAVNVAKKGDTILVHPGTYAPIQTNNRKISIKSVKGLKRSKICATDECITLDLSKKGKRSDTWSWFKGGGSSTTVEGFHCFPKLWGDSRQEAAIAVGGIVKHCSFSDFCFCCGWYRGYGKSARTKVYYLTDHYGCLRMAAGTKFSNCEFQRQSRTYGDRASDRHDYLKCTFQRCVFKKNSFSCSWSTFANCLIAENDETAIYHSRLLNCTFSENKGLWTGDGVFAFNTTMANCILWNNFDCVGGNWSHDSTNSKWIGQHEPVSSFFLPYNKNSFTYTFTDNRDPKFANAAKGNYKLKKGSPCINKGKLTAAQKKLVGATDLAGQKRIKGKAIDRGCYEY